MQSTINTLIDEMLDTTKCYTDQRDGKLEEVVSEVSGFGFRHKYVDVKLFSSPRFANVTLALKSIKINGQFTTLSGPG